MDQELETAQAYIQAKNYEAAFNILHPLSKKYLKKKFFNFFKFIFKFNLI